MGDERFWLWGLATPLPVDRFQKTKWFRTPNNPIYHRKKFGAFLWGATSYGSCITSFEIFLTYISLELNCVAHWNNVWFNEPRGSLKQNVCGFMAPWNTFYWLGSIWVGLFQPATKRGWVKQLEQSFFSTSNVVSWRHELWLVETCGAMNFGALNRTHL